MSNLYNTLQCHLAILAPFAQEKLKPLGKQTTLIEAFFQAARKKNISCAVFSPESLLIESDIPGVYHDGRQWNKACFEPPGAIYDRFYSTMTGFDSGIELIKDRLAQKFPIINPIKLARDVTDKHRFSILMDSLKILSPEVIPDVQSTPDQMIRFLKKAPDIIIKPRFGRMGRGIIRVHRIGSRFEIPGIIPQMIMQSPDETFGAITALLKQHNLNLADCIIQKTIDIPSVASRFFDLRFLVQRTDGDSDPEITGAVARLSHSAATVPNLDQGGLVIGLDQIFRYFSESDEQKKLIQTIESQVLSAYQKLENRFGKTGELGIDVLVNTKRQPVIVEMNAKPGRIAFQRMASGFGLSDLCRRKYQDIRDTSIRNPIMYGKWLCDHQSR